MPQTFVIDQAATFAGVAFLQSAPRMVFGSRTEQDRTADGLGKWEIQCVAGFRDSFGGSSHEVIKVNVAASRDPGEGLNPYTPVHLIGFTVGVIPAEMGTDRNGAQKVKGGTTWYRADEVRPTSQPGRGKSAAAE
jgi:hypothetical protein